MNILGIDNIVLGVTDLDAARHFYGTVLGLTEKYAFLDRGVVGYSIGDETPGFVIRLNREADYADRAARASGSRSTTLARQSRNSAS